MALVTGGASGLGRATVERLAKQGSKVVFCDLATSNGTELCEMLGDNVTYIPANVKHANEVENVMKEIDRIHGQLNVVVNCAGIMHSNSVYNFTSKRACDHNRFMNILQVS